MIKSLLLGMRWVFKLQDLQMFGLKLTNMSNFRRLKLWIEIARHNLDEMNEHLNSLTQVL